MKRFATVCVVGVLLWAPVAFADVLSPWDLLKLRPVTGKAKVDMLEAASAGAVSGDLDARTPAWEVGYGRSSGAVGLEAYMLVDSWMNSSGAVFRGGDIPRSRLSGGGETPLMTAVRSCVEGTGGDVSALSTLIDLGSDVDARDVRGMTPLMIAIEAEGRHYSDDDSSSPQVREAVDCLLKRGADIDARDRWGRTALMILASQRCYPDLIGRLLESGANVDLRDDEGDSALMRALRERDAPTEGIMRLLGAKMDPAALRSPRGTALRLAVHAEPAVQERLLAFEWTQAEKNDALLEIPSTGRPDLERIRLLTQHGADLNARDAEGKNILMRFLALPYNERDGSWDDVAALVGMGLDVKVSDDRGYTCLHASLRADDVKTLLEAGAEPDAVALDGRTPLFFANDPEAIDLLIARGADVNRRDREGATPLLTLLRRKTSYGEGNPGECIGRLLDAGTDLDRADLGGTTPLMVLVNDPSGEEGPDYSEWVEAFLERGADPHARRFDGRTALLIVLAQPTRYEQVGRDEYAELDIFEWQKEKIGLLLAAGANPDEPDLFGKSAWDVLAEHRDPRLREAMEAFEVLPPPDAGRTPLMRAVLASDDVKALEKLIASGESLASRDRYGWTPLMFAAWGNPDARVTRLLLDRGADPNARDALGRTPLMLAAWRNENRDVFHMLRQCGADLSLRDFMGNNPIDMAIACDRPSELLEYLQNAGVTTEEERVARSSGMLLAAASVTADPDTIRTLLRPGVPVDCRDADGQTPLMKAVSANGRPEIVKALILAGADLDAKDARGISVLDYALKGNREILNMLILAGIDPGGDSAYWKVWEKLLLVPDARERLREAGEN